MNGNLYWLSTNYETDNGEVLVISHEENTDVPESSMESALPNLKIYSGKGVVRVSILGGDASANNTFTRLDVTNLQGETVHSASLKPGQSVVDFPAPAPGVYLVGFRPKQSLLQRALPVVVY